MDIFSGKQILIPIVALVLLAVFNLIADPSFYKITLDVNSAGNHVLSGYLITILDYGSELAILAIGMTLVWRTGYFCWCRYRDCRFGYPSCTLRHKFPSGSSAGSNHCSLSRKLRGSYALWCI